MTASLQRPFSRRGRTFGLFRILAPAVTLVAFWLAFAVDDPVQALSAAGQGTMMLAITLYAFRLKGRPVTDRPPVHFAPEACLYVAVLLLGTMIWAFAVAGIAGAALVALAAAALVLWMRSTPGRTWRASLPDTA